MSVTTSSYLLILKKSALICVCGLAYLFIATHSLAQTADPAVEKEATVEVTTPDTEQTPKAPEVNAPTQDELLATQSPSDQVWWLNTDEEKFLALYIREQSGQQNHGAVIILPDLGRPADWPAQTRNLRQILPKHGWHTLAINPSNNTQQLQSRLTASIAELHRKNIHNIAIIAEGKTALDAINYIYSHAGQVRAITLINPSHQSLIDDQNKSVSATEEKIGEETKSDEKSTNTEIANQEKKPPEPFAITGQHDDMLTMISSLSIPCLDLTTDKSARDIQLAKSRLTASKTLEKGQYQQISIPDSLYPEKEAKENPVSKRIRGWLNKNALPPPKSPSM